MKKIPECEREMKGITRPLSPQHPVILKVTELDMMCFPNLLKAEPVNPGNYWSSDFDPG